MKTDGGTTLLQDELDFRGYIEDNFQHLTKIEKHLLLKRSLHLFYEYRSKNIDITLEQAIVSSSGGIYDEGY